MPRPNEKPGAPLMNAMSVRLTQRQRAAVDLLSDRLSVNANSALRVLLEVGLAHSPDLERELDEAGHGVRTGTTGDLLDLGAQHGATEDDAGVSINLRSRSR